MFAIMTLKYKLYKSVNSWGTFFGHIVRPYFSEGAISESFKLSYIAVDF